MAYKVFTNGSVLQASEVNENLMQQAVATFSNAAARTAAITSPLEGQVSYLLDVDRYEHWSGSSWVSPFGMTLINRTAFTAATTVTVNNVFSSTYDNYLIDLYLTQNTASSNNRWTLVNGGTVAASNWGHNNLKLAGAGISYNGGGSNDPTPGNFPVNPSNQFAASFKLYSPFIANRTFSFVESITQSSGFGGNDSVWQHAVLNNNTSYEGFRFYVDGGTITGTLRFYGIRNS